MKRNTVILVVFLLLGLLASATVEARKFMHAGDLSGWKYGTIGQAEAIGEVEDDNDLRRLKIKYLKMFGYL